MTEKELDELANIEPSILMRWLEHRGCKRLSDGVFKLDTAEKEIIFRVPKKDDPNYALAIRRILVEVCEAVDFKWRDWAEFLLSMVFSFRENGGRKDD